MHTIQAQKSSVIRVISGISLLAILLAYLVSIHLITPSMFMASIAYFLMLSGLIFRKQRRLHVRLMASAIILDLSLVLILQIKRNAVQTAMAFTLEPIQQAHVGASSVATVLYFPILFLGIQLYRGKISSEKWSPLHRKLGVSAFVFRTLGFVLMFSLLSHVMPS